ncbi:MAG: plastocyanin/azurin family copper-binding protein [Halobacteria archaeon]
MKAVEYKPREIEVESGDKVAWKHVSGESHTVTAYGDQVPEDGEYFASGGFPNQKKAEEGWENSKGAVQSGQSYVHVFKNPGTYKYFCIPHEMAGMKGKITVKK